jgi:hypothetical protein
VKRSGEEIMVQEFTKLSLFFLHSSHFDLIAEIVGQIKTLLEKTL